MPDLPDKLAGRFLVIDGPDGSGKSTQTALLVEFLRGRGLSVMQVRDPGGTRIGDRVRELLLDPDCEEMTPPCERMLYMASRAQLVSEIIRPALEAGDCVIADRYISSTIAYQGAGGMDAEEIRTVGDIATGRTWPDLTILLDIPADEGLARIARTHDRVESKGIYYHRRVRKIFLDEATQRPRRHAIVDASGSVEQVHQTVLAALRSWRFPR